MIKLLFNLTYVLHNGIFKLTKRRGESNEIR